MLNALRWILIVLLGLGVPVFIYVAFIADEPVMEVEYDVAMGERTVESIAADPEEYPVLSEDDYPAAYAYLRGLVREISESDEIRYRDVFSYDSVKIIDDDATLNAFCAPGGFIYVYTGLIRYLDAEDHLAGVLGHEIAHAERRHSSLQLQKEYGKQRLLEFLALTAPVGIRDIAFAAIVNELTDLKYSREHEAESDEYSVHYLADTRYACDGAAGFFEKIVNEGDMIDIPAFLSDHPDPPSRIRDIRGAAQATGCSTELGDQARWREFQASLPEVE
jgi:Zn-dependent protease with chaperone function